MGGPMRKRGSLVFLCVVIVCALTAMFIVGCKGSDSREKVDDVVEEMTGKKNVDRMQRMKKDIDQIKDLQQKRYDEMDDTEDE